MHAPRIHRPWRAWRVAATLGLWAAAGFGSAPAWAAPFTCDGSAYIMDQSGGGSSYLYRVSLSGSNLLEPMLGGAGFATVAFNSLGYNPVDNYLYAMRRPLDSNPTSQPMPGQRGIFRLGTTGAVQMANVSAGGNNAYIRITGLPDAMVPNSGTFDAAGNYFMTAASIGPIYRIRNLAGVPDHAASGATTSPVVAAEAIPVVAAGAGDTLPDGYVGIGSGMLGDLAVSAAESSADLTVMYGIYGTEAGVVYVYRLALHNPSGSLTDPDPAKRPVARLSRRATNLPTAASAGLFGSVYLDATGSMYVYRNSINATQGGLYRMAPRAAGSGPVIATPAGNPGPRVTVSDAAACALPLHLDVVKQAGAVQALEPLGRRFRVPYTITVGNTDAAPAPALPRVQVSENLRATFASGNPTLNIAGAPTITSGSCVANAGFNGGAGTVTPDYRLLDGLVDLPAGQSCTIHFSVELTYADLASVPSAAQHNTAWGSAAGGTAPNPGHTWGADPTQSPLPPAQVVAVDPSNDSGTLPTPPGSDNADPQPTPVTFAPPAIDVVKSAGTVVSRAPNQFEVPYTVVVGNTGALALPRVQVSENLQQTFPTASAIGVSGLTATGGGTPAATCTANPGFSGQGALLAGNDSLAPGQSCTIAFTALVSYADAASVPATPQQNTALASATGGSTPNPGHTWPGGTPTPPADAITDDSTAGNALPGAPNGDTPAPTPVELTGPSVSRLPNLALTQSVAPGAVFQPGSTGRFSYSVVNQGAGPTSAPLTVLAQLPTGLSFAATGTVTVNGWSCTITGPAHATCTSPGPLAAGGASAFELDVLVDPGVTAGSTLAAQSKVFGGGDTGKPDANAGGVAIGACAGDGSTVTGCGFESVGVAAVPASGGVTAVPTLQQWALAMLALLMLAAAAWRTPRRR